MSQDLYLQKIGKMITKMRQEKGLTQSELAKDLGTSQSAINRIESGNQNLTLETLARISEVLDQEIVSISDQKLDFKIKGGFKLRGSVTCSGAKNSALGVICASILNQGTTTLKNVPKIEEVNRILEVLASIGVKIKWEEDGDLIITPPTKLKLSSLDVAAAKRTRTVIMLMGPLMHLAKKFNLPFAGGCQLGARTVEPHIMALSKLGLKVDVEDDSYHCISKPKKADRIVLIERGDTVTENLIMAASVGKGKVEIVNASYNYIVLDLIYYLRGLGVKFSGIGTSNLVIEGVENINQDTTYGITEDPIEAMSYLTAGIVTDSKISVKRVPRDFIEIELLNLSAMNLKFKLSPTYKALNGETDLVDIELVNSSLLKSPVDKIHSQSYPAINMDNLPFFALIASKAKGRTLIHDWSYESRLIHLLDLTRIGVNIELADKHRIFVDGPTEFKPASVTCPPALRPAMLILIGMLAAPGTSILRDVYSIKRGYESVVEKLNSLGAKISVMIDIQT
ncbi:MAG TPA: UDP-N-acetylglucosamine 1-carboxyvinyltransferase [Candidatus Saccharibacteria bacterium]|jgi:UDP-N-acetylglucosamine 1-carboxyvinyltransferase|nr:UDP-N-acetylglucosamine 1-carboxyvinyltransferase [Candidatus Saccharibacteria bacterium]